MVTLEILPESIKFLKLSDQEYFSEKYSDYISNSKLSLLNPEEDGSIEKFLEGFKQSYSDSFEIGTAVHNTLLQSEYYKISDIKKPNGKLGLFIENIYKFRNKGLSIQKSIELASAESDYYSGKLTRARLKTAIKSGLSFYLDRIKIKDDSISFLSESIYPKYLSCIDSINRNKRILNLLNPEGMFSPPEVYNEYAILCEIKVSFDTGEEINIKIKGKLDNFTIDHDSSTLILNDLKTTGKPANFFMGNNVKLIDDEGNAYWKWIDGSFQKYRYYRQLAMYNWLMQAAIQQKYGLVYKSKCNIILVETIPNFQSVIYPVYNSDIKKGLSEMKKLIVILAKWKMKN